MAGTMAARDSTTAGAANGSGVSTPAPNVVGSRKTPAQVMANLMAEMTKLLDTQVTVENQEEHNT